MTIDVLDDEELLKTAVAIFYPGDRDPEVTAKGYGKQAEEIIRIAEENNVPLCDNAPLVEMLSRLELGDSIPESLYWTIAHVIAFAYKIQLDVMDNAEDLK